MSANVRPALKSVDHILEAVDPDFRSSAKWVPAGLDHAGLRRDIDRISLEKHLADTIGQPTVWRKRARHIKRLSEVTAELQNLLAAPEGRWWVEELSGSLPEREEGESERDWLLRGQKDQSAIRALLSHLSTFAAAAAEKRGVIDERGGIGWMDSLEYPVSSLSYLIGEPIREAFEKHFREAKTSRRNLTGEDKGLQGKPDGDFVRFTTAVLAEHGLSASPETIHSALGSARRRKETEQGSGAGKRHSGTRRKRLVQTSGT